MNFSPKNQQRVMRWCKRMLVTFCALSSVLVIYILHTIYHANFRAVVEGQAYRSGQMGADQLARTIERYGIKSILNLRGENPTTSWYQAEIEMSKKLNVVHYDRSLSSGEDMTLEQMDDLVVLLRQAPKPALIHCLGGADRSGLVSALYRLAINDQEPKEADDELSIWYGHVPLIRPEVKAMDRSFWSYVSNHVSHTDLDRQPSLNLP